MKLNHSKWGFLLTEGSQLNRPFARSGHMVRNKLHWDANYAVGLSKQRKVGLDWCEFLCFGLRNLRPSVIYSVPCDRIVQRAYLDVKTTYFVTSLKRQERDPGIEV